jgi:flagellar basal body-associated protein FliL
MATITTDDPSKDTAGESPDEQEAAHAAVGARKKKIKAAGLVVGLTVVMMGVGYLFMPDSNAENIPDGDESAIAAEELDEDTAEIEIGQFNCTNSRAGIDVSVHVNFKLVAEVQKNNEQAFRDAMEAYEARIRDIINSLARSASRDDLNDPRLDTIKREFREGINQVIRKHYIVRVHIPDWQTMER